jgi:biopolymer transport protein ExbD
MHHIIQSSGRVFVFSLLLVFPILVVKAEPARLRGAIRTVNLVEKTVTVHTRQDTTVTLETAEATLITRNGRPARLSDLQSGDRVQAGYDSETLLASAIVATGEDLPETARVEGVIQGVNLEAHTLTIIPREGNPVTLQVTPNTAITLDGRPARLDDLQRGFSAGAAYNPNHNEALRINAEGFAEIRGVISAVDVQQSTFTVAVGERRVTLTVTPNTQIALNGRPATLEDLMRGYRVVASYIAANFVALRVAAESLAEIAGHIRLIEGTTLTIAPLVEGEPVRLFITHNTEITINGQPATFDRLQVGMAVRAVYDVAALTAIRVAAESDTGQCTALRVRGVIVRLDFENRRIALDPREGDSPVILNVLERTEITINERPARFTDLQVGMRVAAGFCRETLNATAIAARSATAAAQ